MDNLEIYEKLRVVPDTAKKSIDAGRLKGMTDISPMWRIKILTEVFGPCGIGWKYELDKQWTELGADGAVMAFCNISLYIKQDEKWSDSIPGTGGAALIAKETKGLYSDDEAFKKALTDAISVAAKALGVGADVYWEKDSKYNMPPAQPIPPKVLCPACGKVVKSVKGKDGTVSTPEEVLQKLGTCAACYKKKVEKEKAADAMNAAGAQEETII